MAIASPAQSTPQPKRYSLEGGIPPKVSKALFLALAVFAIVLPFLMDPISSFLSDIIIALAFVIMALGLNVVVGFAGLLDLGYVAFFAIGAYAVGWFASGFFVDANVHIAVSGFVLNLPGIHANFLIVLVVSMVLCMIGGVLIGLPTLRLRGDYIAIVTLAFGEIIRVFAVNGDQISLPFGDAKLTAGRQGITPVDQVQLPFLDQFTQLNLRPWYWLVLALVFITLFVVIRLRDSRLGRAWIAIREDEVAAASMGVPLVKTKLAAYAVGAAIGGVSGAFQASYLNTVNADQFAFSFSIFVLAMIILGGLGSVWGVVFGALLLSFINSYLIPDVLRTVPEKVGLDFELTDLGFGIFGFLLLIVMVLRPEGLLPEKRRQIELTEGVGTGESTFEVNK
ncbi:MAG: branched-chain amino acid transporter permease [Solirubrobacterales bacterium]|jgi:branched-chain amino acid transport system permease protein|nr:branched-chain amino acid transporter permease [Solirubrobacterales bacterium]